MKKRYPPELFFMGMMIDMIRTGLLPLLSIASLLLGVILPKVPFFRTLALVLVLSWIGYAVVNQFRTRKFLLDSEDELARIATDSDHAHDWAELIRQNVKEKFKEEAEGHEQGDDEPK